MKQEQSESSQVMIKN